MSRVVRSVKNVTKGYSSVQIKVRNATSNDPWGPTGTDMSEIAALTFSNTDLFEIVDMIDRRLNDKGKNWRHVLKSLRVLDYCLHEGSEGVVTWARKNGYLIKTLREFMYIDDEGRDVGKDVRAAAKELTALLSDEDRLRGERSNRKLWKSRVNGLDEPWDPYGPGPDLRSPRPRPRQPADDDDVEYRLAIEASKNEAEEERQRRAKESSATTEEDDLAKAIKLSKEEEDLRRRELEESNAAALFEDIPVQTQSAFSQPTGYNQGYHQQPAVDWFGNPIDPQQPLTTGFLNQQYSQPTGLQPQATGYQNGFLNGFQMQAQPTGYDPMQNYFQSQQPLQPQATTFNNNNPYGADLFGQQQQSVQQDNDFLAPGSHNPWATTNQHVDSLKPQPTGSNNPFAIHRPQTANPITKHSKPTLNTLAEEQTSGQSNNPIMNFRPPQQQTPSSITTQKPMDSKYAHLNNLLANGEGLDTFGNVGDLRIPAQHTAPGVFVNSAGRGADQLRELRAAHNPFMNQTMTGMPQQHPAGAASSNPFGGSFTPQQQQGASLIDL